MIRVLRNFVVLMAVAALALPAAAKDDALSLVPANAVTVGMVKLSDMRSSPLSGFLFLHMDKMSADGEAAKFLSDAGLQPTRDVDTLVVATTPRTTLGSEADVLVIAEGRFQPERLTSALVSRGAVKKGAYLLSPESKKEGNDQNGAVAFLSPSLAIAGTEASVIAALEARANGGTGFRSRGALGLDLGRVDSKATAWALVDVTRAARLAKGGDINTGKGQSGEALQAAIKTLQTVAVWATDTGDALELGAIGLSNDTETLQLLEDTMRGALAAMRLAVKDKQPELVSVLRRFDINRKSDSITVEGSIPAAALRDLMNKKKAAMAVGSK
jgi:hypothetical protein